MKNLFTFSKDQDLIISKFQDDSDHNQRLLAMNFGIGTKIRILQKYNDSIIIAKDNMRLILSSDIASKIFCH